MENLKIDSYATDVKELSSMEIDAVNGGGLFNWISRVTAGYRIVILGVEVSDGIPND